MPAPSRFRRIFTRQEPLAFLRRAGDPLSKSGLVTSRADASARATYYNAQTGLVTLVPSPSAFRDGHYAYAPTMGVSYLSDLLEGSRQNPVTWCSDLTKGAGAPWTLAQCSAALTGTGPDGVANSASILTENVAVGVAHTADNSLGTYTANTTQTVSVFLKSNGRAKGYLIVFNGADGFGAQYDLGAATSVTYVQGTGTATSAGIQSLGNSWYRVWAIGKVNAASTTGSIRLLLANNAGSTSYTGDGVSGVIVYGLQHEKDAAFPSSVIVTGAAAVTRASDVCSAPWNYAPQALTWYGRYVSAGNTGAVGEYLFQIGAGTTSTFAINTTTNGRLQAFSYDGSSNVNVRSAGPAIPVAGDLVEVRYFLAADFTIVCGVTINGGAEALMTGGTNVARTTPAAFSNALLTIGDAAAGSSSMFAAWTHCAVNLGPEQSLAAMRAKVARGY